MSAKEQIVNELAGIPDDLADEVCNFLLSVQANIRFNPKLKEEGLLDLK